MIKNITVAQCDICGKTVPAKRINGQYNDVEYTIPDGWHPGTNPGVHLCEVCSAALLREKGGIKND